MPHRRLATSLIAAVALALPAIAAATGPAQAAEEKSARASCFVGNINNGKTWTVETYNKGASANFAEYGEYLQVKDLKSDGWVPWVRFKWCYDGKSRHYDNFSLPVEGSGWSKSYNLDFAEGRRLSMSICERLPDTTALRNCTGAISFNA